MDETLEKTPQKPPSKTVAIAGASRGLGAALARLYASPGVHLALSARSAGDLERVAEDCRARGATATTSVCDLMDGAAVCAWIAASDSASPISLLIVNAGVFSGRDKGDAFETPEEATTILRTNLEGAVHAAGAMAEPMRQRKSGHIVLVSSLAAAHPLADAPVYSAAKAGLRAYGEALRERLSPSGVRVTVILPGHFESDQTLHHVGKLPLLMSVDRAAALIVRGISGRRGEVAFPAPLVWLVRGGRLLPWQVRAFLGKSQRFYVEKPKPPDDKPEG